MAGKGTDHVQYKGQLSKPLPSLYPMDAHFLKWNSTDKGSHAS